jgi:hypothetical protein
MMVRTAFAVVVAAAPAALVAALAAAGTTHLRVGANPVLHSAVASGTRLRVSYTVPAGSIGRRIEVARKPRVAPSGAFSSGVLLREHLPARSGDVARWRTRGSLTVGRYYVHVSDIDLTGVIDCSPRGGVDCLEVWSNVRRVVVPRA